MGFKQFLFKTAIFFFFLNYIIHPILEHRTHQVLVKKKRKGETLQLLLDPPNLKTLSRPLFKPDI